MSQKSSTSKTHTVYAKRYEIRSAIRHSRNSFVYLAKELKKKGKAHNRENLVALKLYSDTAQDSNEKLGGKAQREALALMSVRHPNVIKLVDFRGGTKDQYVATEYIERGSLRRELNSRAKPLPVDLALSIMKQLLSGLEAIHKAGIVHRDIKPDNLLINEQGQIKIADFSTALLPMDKVNEADNQKGVGTFDYLAPEVLNGKQATPESDIYAAGVTFYELICNRLPFAGASFAERLTNKISGKMTPIGEAVSDVPSGIELLLNRAIAFNPEERYQSACDFRVDIEKIIEALVAGHSLRTESLRERKSTARLDQLKDSGAVSENKIKKTIARWHSTKRSAQARRLFAANHARSA